MKRNNGSEREAGHRRYHTAEKTTMVWPRQSMPEERIPKLTVEGIPRERRKRRRPRKTWMEGVQAAIFCE